MNPGLVAAVVYAWLAGAGVVLAAWPRGRSRCRDWPVIAPLAAAFGLGLTSATYFTASLVLPRPALAASLADAAIVALALGWRLRRDRGGGGQVPAAAGGDVTEPGGRAWLALTLFLQAALAGAVIAGRSYQAEPYGGWDGWAIWNMHARFMYRAGTEWPAALASAQLSWTHPDYPRLVGASVARLWAWSGAESPAAPATVAAVFALATAGLLAGGVWRWRGATIAAAGGLLLVATPFFLTFALNQHADIPFGCWMLAAVLLPGLPGGRGGALLAGVAAAFAAWTKNEGLLFVPVLTLVWGIQAWRRGERRAVGAFLAALVVALAPLLAFKLLFAPPNDLVSAPWTARFAQLIDPARHGVIWAGLRRDVPGFGEWRVVPFLAMLVPFLALRRRRPAPGAALALAVAGLMLAGYYVVYLLSPHALAWHVDTSLVRLLLQVWPVLILGWCLLLPDTAAATVAPRRVSGLAATALVLVNVALGAALLAAASRQLAANEFAAGRIGAQRVTIALGDGWFGLERHGRDTWTWAGQRGVLRLQAAAAVERVTMHFSLVGHGGRGVTVRRGDEVLWQGRVEREWVEVNVSLALGAGFNDIEIATDSPGLPENPAGGGRTLAFAVYNATVR